MPIRPRYADLFRALKDPDPARADAAFDAILFDRAEAVPDLISLYASAEDDATLRFFAVQLMGFSESADAVPAVSIALDDPAAGVRAEACRALEDLRARDMISSLKARTQDLDREVRRAAREAVAALTGGRR